jgi:serine protease Do
MVYRALRIPIGLAAAALFATIVIGGIARPLARQDVQPAFRIVTNNVSEVLTQDVTPEIARALNMCRIQGVVITDVLYSPLLPGDVILSVNGQPVNCQRDLDAALAQLGSEQMFTISVLRNDEVQTIPVQRAMDIRPSVSHGIPGIRGISVANLSTVDGAFVTNVKIGTPASDLGLKTGDIILEVDGHVVHNANEFQDLIGQLNGRQATLNVRQKNGQVNVFVLPY